MRVTIVVEVSTGGMWKIVRAVSSAILPDGVLLDVVDLMTLPHSAPRHRICYTIPDFSHSRKNHSNIALNPLKPEGYVFPDNIDFRGWVRNPPS